MLDFSKIKTYPIALRKNKVTTADFIRPDKLPEGLLDTPDLQRLAEHILAARNANRPVLWMMGAHVVKTGLNPLIINLLERKIITHIATNGAGSIHDFEVALIGATSEYVEETITDGSFGMAEETGRLMNEAIQAGAKEGWGMGYALGYAIDKLNLPHKEESYLYRAFKLSLPVTLHVAIGTDIIHQHPACDGAALGQTSYADFKKIAETVSQLEGGVVLNVGSSVLMPEVFLKALSVARNLGNTVKKFTAANLDMLEHYRPNENVLKRPTAGGGTALFIKGRHEVTVPSLYRLLVGPPPERGS